MRESHIALIGSSNKNALSIVAPQCGRAARKFLQIVDENFLDVENKGKAYLQTINVAQKEKEAIGQTIGPLHVQGTSFVAS